jgi:hypothetical protein
VLAAAALLAASLAFNLYGELNFFFVSLAVGANPSFAVGRLFWPLLWLAVQVWLLFKLVQGRNWARIVFIVVVVLGVAFRYLLLHSLESRLSGYTTTISALLQTLVELVAVLLVLIAGQYFSQRASA